jgi:hypothetical protein
LARGPRVEGRLVGGVVLDLAAVEDAEAAVDGDVLVAGGGVGDELLDAVDDADDGARARVLLEESSGWSSTA